MDLLWSYFDWLCPFKNLCPRERFTKPRKLRDIQCLKKRGWFNNINPVSPTALINGYIAMPSTDSSLLTYEQIETWLSQLEDAIKITTEQSKIWGNFSAKARLYAGDAEKERARLNSDTKSAMNGLSYLSQSCEDVMSRCTSLKEVNDAAKPLLKLLCLEQKTTFDSGVPTLLLPALKNCAQIKLTTCQTWVALLSLVKTLDQTRCPPISINKCVAPII